MIHGFEYEISAYAPYISLPDSRRLIEEFFRILNSTGINDNRLFDRQDEFAKALQRNEGIHFAWQDKLSFDNKYPVALDIMRYLKSSIDDSWSIRFHIVLRRRFFVEDEVSPDERFLPGTSGFLWNLIRALATDIGSEGVFLFHEHNEDPWSIVTYETFSDKKDIDRLWQFHMAFVPNQLLHLFANPPGYITSKRFEDGTGFISHGGAEVEIGVVWPIIWPELPWQPD